MAARLIGIYGPFGVGKTYQAALFQDGEGLRKVIIDIENKADETLEYHLREGNIEDEITVLTANAYNPDYSTDTQAKHTKIKSVVAKVIEEDYDIIVLDSISYLRNPVCADYYMVLNGFKGISEHNWKDVNTVAWRLIAPLMNFCKDKNKTLIIIGQLKEEYEGKGDNKIFKGFIPDIPKAFTIPMNTLIGISRDDDGNYIAKCDKSACGQWEEDITTRALSDVFKEKKLL